MCRGQLILWRCRRVFIDSGGNPIKCQQKALQDEEIGNRVRCEDYEKQGHCISTRTGGPQLQRVVRNGWKDCTLCRKALEDIDAALVAAAEEEAAAAEMAAAERAAAAQVARAPSVEEGKGKMWTKVWLKGIANGKDISRAREAPKERNTAEQKEAVKTGGIPKTVVQPDMLRVKAARDDFDARRLREMKKGVDGPGVSAAQSEPQRRSVFD